MLLQLLLLNYLEVVQSVHESAETLEGMLINGGDLSPYPNVGDVIYSDNLGVYYTITQYLDYGTETRIYEAVAQANPADLRGIPSKVAIKYLIADTPDFITHLKNEIRFYSSKLKFFNIFGIPKFYDYKIKNENEIFILLTKYDQDLHRVIEVNTNFNPPIVTGSKPPYTGKYSLEYYLATVGIKLIEILYTLHDIGVSHNDVYAYNVVTSEDLKEVFVIDFGQARLKEEMIQERFARKVIDDISDVKIMLIWLINFKIEKVWGRDAVQVLSPTNPLVIALQEDEETFKGGLRELLNGFLDSEYVTYSGHIVLQNITNAIA
jgi:serine/threonine protein kinase